MNKDRWISMTRRLHLQIGKVCLYSVAIAAAVYGTGTIVFGQEDCRSLVSRADLIYHRPVDRPVEGQPIGNGRMGSMVWTSPGAIHLQINRNDVFAVNRNHAGKREGPADYCGGVATILVDVGGKPFQSGNTFLQHLSLYDAECAIRGTGVSVRCFVSTAADVLVMEIDDQRDAPSPLQVRISMLREPEVRTGEHVARSIFADSADRTHLVQRFQEREHDNASAVAATILGVGVRVEAPNVKERTLVAPAARGKRTILISSAATWSPQADVGAAASSLLNLAAPRSVEDLRHEHRAWWSEFWSRTFVDLSSPDGIADFMGNIRYLQLYLMASSSRGTLPAKWNGSIFAVDGDHRYWGAQFWVWTTEISHYPLYAADADELTRPFFDMYVNQLPEAEKAARQRWNSQGAYFLEAGPFDGPVVLPDEIATEYQDVYLGRKSVKDLSPAALALGQYECVLTQFADGHGFRGEAGRYSFVSHIASSGSEVASQAWWRYRYTGDEKWLATHAYPLLKGTVEFYRGLTQTDDATKLREKDGKYHLYGLNQHEGYWGVNDGLTDLAAIRGTAPLAIRAAEILKVDADLRDKWRDLLANLAPYPMGSDPQSVGAAAPDIWSIGHKGPSGHLQPDPGEGLMWPIFPFEDWTLESPVPETGRIARKFAEGNSFRVSMLTDKPWGTAIFGSATRTPIVGSRTGRGEDLPAILASYYYHYKPLCNGFSEFEGAKAHSIEHLGSISMTLNEALLQSVSPRPGEPEIIRVFPAWPRSWDATYRLLARGGFLVSSAVRKGNVEFVEIQSRRGEPCQLRNPWDGPCVVSQVDGASQMLEGEILRFQTVAGKRYRVVPQGDPPTVPRRNNAPPTGRPWSYATTLPGGKQVNGMVGCPHVP